MTERRKNRRRGARAVAESLQEYGRGVAGGLIFSLPLLYTMEVWWAGFTAHPWRLVVYVLATFVLLLGYNRFAGLRRDTGMSEVAIDSVEELGIGLVLSGLILFLLGRITLDMNADEMVGRVVIEAMTVAIGVSVGTDQLGGGEKNEEGLEGDEAGGSGQSGGGGEGEGKGAADEREQAQARADPDFGTQEVLAFCGAVLFAANVAPTEEIVMIAIEISVWRLVGLSLVSLLVGSLILYFSEFTGTRKFVRREGFKTVLFGTVFTYATALVAAALMLWFFGRFDGQAPATCLAQTVVLGVAATLGASAGRLLLQK